MNRFFNLNAWSKIEKSLEQKPNILVSQFAIIAIIAAFFQVVNDLINTNYIAVMLDMVLAGIFIITFLVNEKRFHLCAKFIFVVCGTGYIFVYAALIPKSIGAYLVFFPIIALVFLIFSNEERHYKYFSVAYVLILLFILEITNYQPFGEMNVTQGKSEGSSFYVNMLISVFGMVFSMYNMDIINKKIDEVRLATLKELEQKNNELELANDELDHFVYSASHDLKAPLLSILGLINIAKYEVKENSILEYFLRIENRVQRLTQFIKEVIEISKNTRTEVKVEAVDLKELLDNIIENNNYIEGVKNIHFKKDINLNVPIPTDKSRLEVILNNLISNAIKYMDKNKRQKKIIIVASETTTHFEISIKDNGIGIPKDQQHRVFDMFYRGAQSREGSGLGLYIVQNMVFKFGGNINFHSEEGEGTVFTISLPKILNRKYFPF
ncbi:HAMP domain-containing sensor histidine kinase [Marivirga sp.]|uniref:sensor histidine kinase n=1 Tax=Marivirga sp. TaxID=2018662 RepID=UPI002D80DA9B|nr:HAMP domain-containing sensor histidine kinase [Marivirga sp.]HET8859675.1 HAMP domain-containing sensor histidine kinase [Marivirga sp.]